MNKTVIALGLMYVGGGMLLDTLFTWQPAYWALYGFVFGMLTESAWDNNE